MIRRLYAALAIALLLPAPASAWSWATHRFIMRRAIDVLPPEIKPFFIEHKEEVVYRAIDPDLWRDVGWEEDPNHFVNFGAPELGPYPFAALPRDHTAALEKFGESGLKRIGTLPWRLQEMVGNLRRAFEGFAKGSGLAPQQTVLFSGAASHYMQDATQPFHASNDYDGQLSGQRGIHARFEQELLERFESRITLRSSSPRPIASLRDHAFDTMLASHQKVDTILKADKEALGSKDTYDDEYFESFFNRVRPAYEAQLSIAVADTASIIVTAWEQAGRPALTLPKRAPQKVQRTR
jgi:Zinc dependent phospholipase C